MTLLFSYLLPITTNSTVVDSTLKLQLFHTDLQMKSVPLGEIQELFVLWSASPPSASTRKKLRGMALVLGTGQWCPLFVE